MTTPGYIQPNFTQPIPRHLNLIQFIQTVLVGISGIAGPLVRPKWQIDPPKNPDIDVSWIAFGIEESTPDANGFVGTNLAGVTTSQRHAGLRIPCHFYGPAGLDVANDVRDGFQIPQNRDALRSANMGFVETSRALHLPDLVNERWLDRWVMEVVLRYETVRTYPIPILISAHGNIHTVLGNEDYLLAWATQT